MQETDTTILPPGRYDWTTFANKPFGFQREWCRNHLHKNGQPFNHRTVNILINGHYDSNPGPKIAEIISAALKEGLIVAFTDLAEAA